MKPAQSSTPPLTSCPFCGGEASFGKATIQREVDWYGQTIWKPFTGHFVNCIICGASNQGICEGFKTQEAAAEKWNRRFVEAGSESEELTRYRAMVEATKSHVDGRDLLYELNPNGAHFINIRVRINGAWKEYEGDWLKRLMWARDGNNRGGRPEMPEGQISATGNAQEASSRG